MAKEKTDPSKMVEVCNILSTSHLGIVKICKQVGISSITFYNWLEDSEDNQKRYARAREEQADLLVEEMIELSDEKNGDTLNTTIGEQGNSANVARSKLQVDTRKWLASKLRPKKYGDKIEVENTGEVKIITANFGSPIIPTTSQPTENTQLD
jgi:hypothetical protein